MAGAPKSPIPLREGGGGGAGPVRHHQASHTRHARDRTTAGPAILILHWSGHWGVPLAGDGRVATSECNSRAY